MRYIGVDLAWGRRNPTGLADVDEHGVLCDVTRAVTDDEILAWARPRTTGPCWVGIDAPIVVPNATGSRACERAVGRWFGRYGASCHPANTSMPAFAEGTRAQFLVDLLGLDADPSPASGAPRRAFEVYPHQAAVMLFGLTSVLRYKNKPGRDLPGLRSELLRLVHLLESLVTHEVPLDVRACAAWERLREAVAAAGTKAALRRCEDPVDAVLAAYVVRVAHRRPDLVRVLGDGPRGHVLCVVTPELGMRMDATSGDAAWS